MRQKVINSLIKAMKLTEDLLEAIPEDKLSQKLGGETVYSFGEQFWCIMGGRECSRDSIKKGGDVDFYCSLNQTEANDKTKLIKGLKSSFESTKETLESPEIEWNDFREETLLEFLEHEVRHHGQMLRYGKVFEIDFPKSWSETYYL